METEIENQPTVPATNEGDHRQTYWVEIEIFWGFLVVFGLFWTGGVAAFLMWPETSERADTISAFGAQAAYWGFIMSIIFLIINWYHRSERRQRSRK